MLKACSPNTRICAMCFHWNGYSGGTNVKPRKGMMNVYEYDPEEKKICYKNHFEKSAWNSCSQWQKKF